MDALLEPYKAENARLVRENNELHLGLLKLREEKDRLSRGTKLTTPTTHLNKNLTLPIDHL